MKKPLQLICVLAAACFALPAPAQSFPNKPLRWIVPFPPGGSTDAFSRPLAAKLSELVGQPVVVENVGGAGASIGADRIAKSAPDGYTIGLATTGTHAINPTLYRKLPHDTLKDFTHLTLAVRYANVLVVNPSVPVNSVNELVAYAKANPGKVTFGSAGNGSSNHLSGEVLKYLTGAPMTHVPYKGSGSAMTDVLAGNLTFMFDVLVTSLPQIAAGRVKPLALTSDRRSPHAPDIPSMPEAGVKGFNEAGSDLWFGVVGPAGIPKPIVAILNAKLIEALNQPDLRARIKAQAFDVWTSTPEEFARVVERDRASWGKIVKASGATVD
jgi:tripartite-type tricarboxylate transporter receptor subunit TctC